MFNERGQVCMNEQHEGLRTRLVVNRKRDGRRKYGEDAKRELIHETGGVDRADGHGARHQSEPCSDVDLQVSARTSRGRNSQLHNGVVARGSRRDVDGFGA